MENEQKPERIQNRNLMPPPKPGEVRNPKGRGKGVKNRATYYKEIMNLKVEVTNPITQKPQKITVEKAIAMKLTGKALAGDLKAVQMVHEILYGKIPIDVNLGGQPENPVMEKKIAERSVIDLLILKYGVDSEQVRLYREQNPDNSNSQPQ